MKIAGRIGRGLGSPVNIAKLLAPLAVVAALGIASVAAAHADHGPHPGDPLSPEEQAFLRALNAGGMSWPEDTATVRAGLDTCTDLITTTSANDEALKLERTTARQLPPWEVQLFVQDSMVYLCPFLLGRR